MLGKDINMKKELSAKDNIRKSKIITLSSTLFATILFLIVFLLTENYWLLALSVLMFISGIFFLYFVNQFERKYISDINEKSD